MLYFQYEYKTYRFLFNKFTWINLKKNLKEIKYLVYFRVKISFLFLLPKIKSNNILVRSRFISFRSIEKLKSYSTLLFSDFILVTIN